MYWVLINYFFELIIIYRYFTRDGKKLEPKKPLLLLKHNNNKTKN